MRLLLDANLSPALARGLTEAGFPAKHVAEIGLLAATDDVIFDAAERDQLVIVTSDSDFPMMLALSRTTAPSVVLLRHVNPLTTRAVLTLLVNNLASVTVALDAGAIVSLSPQRMAVRSLPVG